MKRISLSRQPLGWWARRRAGGLTLVLMLFGTGTLPSLAQQTGMAGNSPESIYKSTCAYCHSRVLPPFPAPELLGRNLDPQTIQHFVRHGPGGMIAFRPSDIADDDLNRLSVWIAASPLPQKQPVLLMPQSQGVKP